MMYSKRKDNVEMDGGKNGEKEGGGGVLKRVCVHVFVRERERERAREMRGRDRER